MLSGMLRRVFCFLRIATSVAVSGLSMPTKTPTKLALRHQLQEFGIVGEIERGFGGELERIVARFEPPARSGRNAFTAFLLPMRLSSTKSTWPR